MVIGLTPIFLFWNYKVPKISFYLSVGCGLLFGFLLIFKAFPEALIFTKGRYAIYFGSMFGGFLVVTFYISFLDG